MRRLSPKFPDLTLQIPQERKHHLIPQLSTLPLQLRNITKMPFPQATCRLPGYFTGSKRFCRHLRLPGHILLLFSDKGEGLMAVLSWYKV